MGFWVECRPDFTTPILEKKYDDVKTFDIPQGNAIEAYRVTQWIKHSAYRAVARNCEDDVYDVLRMYGVPDLEVPFFNWFPRWWFGRLRGEKRGIEGAVSATSPSLGPKTENADLAPLRPPWRNPLHPQHHRLNAMKLLPRFPKR